MADKVKGKTASGFAFEIDSDVFKDWRFLKAVQDATSDDGGEQLKASMKLVKVLFNDAKQEDAFYEFLAKQNDGRVPVDVVGKEVGEIMKIITEKSKEAKN